MRKDLRLALSDRDYFKLDGSHGAVLISNGIDPSQVVYAAIKHPEILSRICSDYLKCGCNIMVTSTFGVSSTYTLNKEDREQIITQAVRIANEVREPFPNTYVGLDIGPTGKLVWTKQDMAETKARFAEQIEINNRLNATDFIFFETFGNLAELEIAYSVARSLTDLPIFTAMTFGENEHTWFGNSLDEYINFINTARPDAAGLNCTLKPDKMLTLIKKIKAKVDIPIIAEPNRGDPVMTEGDKPVYKLAADIYARGLDELRAAGADIVGGCCGADKQCMMLAK